ncbi:MucBP domain-containing protein [Lacticaseibacillus sp. N501-2]|uniref:MucBP domain-containing protein n=1 Tax=Lacticaseibacillus salsurae TaxID=3367729 RepID=UPI0038B356A8
MKLKLDSKHNYVRMDAGQKIHYKMFKDGKIWVFSGLVTSFFTVMPLMQGNTVQADTISDDDAGAYISRSDSGTTSNVAVLKASVAKTTTTETPATTKAQLEIMGAQATRADNGTVIVTGTTAANAQIAATTADGAAQTVTADANGQFSVTLTTQSTVVLKASLDGHVGEPTAVVAPKAAATTTAESTAATPTPAATATATASAKTETAGATTSTPVAAKAATTVAAPKSTTTADTQKPETATAVDANADAVKAATATTTESDTPAVQDQTSAVKPVSTTDTEQTTTVDPLAVPVDATEKTEITDNITTLVDPSNDELEAAKALAAEAFKKTGITQTIQAVAAGSVADSIFKTTDLTVETVDDKGETADKASPSGDFTGESKAEATFTVKGIDPSSDLAGDHVYVSVLVPKGINVTDANGEGELNFTINPYATLVAVMNYNTSAPTETVKDIKAHVEEFVNESGDTQLREGLNQKFTVKTPYSTPATLTKVDNGTMITVDLADVPNLTTDLEKAFQGGLNTVISSWGRVPIIGWAAGILAYIGLGWWVGGDVDADPAKFLSSVIEQGILTDMSATVKSTLTVDNGTHVVTGDDPQPVTIKGAITTAKTADDLGTGAGTTKLYYVDQTNSGSTSTGTDDPGDTTPTTDGFPVTYKYLDENGTEIPNSAKTAHVAKDGEIDFNPLDPPSGYTFDPAKTTLDVGSVIANEIQSSFSDAKDFDSLNSSMKTMGLTNPNQYTDYGSDELTITYKGKKTDAGHHVSIHLVDADGNPVKNTNGVSTIEAGKYLYSPGAGIDTSGYNYKVDGYTMRPNPATTHYTVTDAVGDQVITVVYDKNKSTTGGDDGGTGTTDQTTTGTVKVKLVDTEGKVVTNDAGQTELSYSGTIGDPIVVPDEAKKVTGRSITGGGDGTLGKLFTEAPQELKITYTPAPAPATTGKIIVKLVDKNGDPVKNKSGQSSYEIPGKIGTQVDTSVVDKQVDGYHIAAGDDGTAKTLTITTADPQVVKIIYTPTPATTGTITVKLVDKNGDPVKNKSGQSSYEIPGEIGSQANTTVVDKEVDGYHIAAGDDGTAKPLTITADAQTVKITYTKDGARVYTPDNPGTFKGGDPTQVYQRYLIGRLTNRVVYKGDIAELPEQHDFDDESVTVYRTATVAEDGSIVYTPWTTDPSGLGGSDDTTLLAGIPDDATHVPVVAGAKATIDAETNQAISSDDLPLVTKTKGNIDATGGGTIGSKAYNQFTVTRTVNYTSDEPKPEWHDAPSDKTDDRYAETHKTLTIKIVANKDSQTTTQATQHVTFTRKYQIDANHPDLGVIDYGEWIADSDTNGGFMYDDTDVLKASYTPTPFDHYTVTPTTVDKSTLDDQQKTVGDEITATAADTKDADNEITVTVNYEPTAVDRIEHPAPPEEDNAHYNETHKQLTVTVQAVQPDGTTKNVGTQTLNFTRTYFTDGNATGDDADKTIDLGTWKQAEPFASVTPDAIDGFTADPAEVTDAAVDTKGDTIKQAATDFAAQKDDEDGSITVNVTYSKVVEGTGIVHYVYQNVGGIELQPPVTVSGPEGTDYSTQYKIPDTLESDGKDLPDAGGTLDTSVLFYYATADINGGQINSLPDNGSADAAFKTDGQDIWVIYVAKPKPGDAAKPLTVTSSTTDKDGNTIITFSDGNTATVYKGDKGDDGATPLVRDGEDGMVEFYVKGPKGDGTDDTVLGSIKAPKNGDTIETTPQDPTTDHPAGGTNVIIHHGDGSKDSTTTIWNGDTPTVDPNGTKNEDGSTTYNFKVGDKTVGSFTVAKGDKGDDWCYPQK